VTFGGMVGPPLDCRRALRPAPEKKEAVEQNGDKADIFSLEATGYRVLMTGRLKERSKLGLLNS